MTRQTIELEKIFPTHIRRKEFIKKAKEFAEIVTH